MFAFYYANFIYANFNTEMLPKTAVLVFPTKLHKRTSIPEICTDKIQIHTWICICIWGEISV